MVEAFPCREVHENSVSLNNSKSKGISLQGSYGDGPLITQPKIQKIPTTSNLAENGDGSRNLASTLIENDEGIVAEEYVTPTRFPSKGGGHLNIDEMMEKIVAREPDEDAPRNEASRSR